MRAAGLGRHSYTEINRQSPRLWPRVRRYCYCRGVPEATGATPPALGGGRNATSRLATAAEEECLSLSKPSGAFWNTRYCCCCHVVAAFFRTKPLCSLCTHLSCVMNHTTVSRGHGHRMWASRYSCSFGTHIYAVATLSLSPLSSLIWPLRLCLLARSNT